MSQAKLQHHLKVDSNVASFGGTVTTTVSAAEGSSLRSVEKNAVLTERQLDDMYRRNHLQLGGSDASLTSSGTGDSASEGGSSAGSAVSSGVSTDSVELLQRRQQLQLLQQPPPPPPPPPPPQPKPPQQEQRFASLLTVERGPAAWASHAQVTFRYRSDRLYYLDSAGRLHGPMDQREQCQVASVRRHVTRSDLQPAVATRSHRTVQVQQQQQQQQTAPTATFDDGLLLLDHRFTTSATAYAQQQQQQQHRQQWHGGSGGVYSRVQVNQYSDEWGPSSMPRSYSQQLDQGAAYRRQSSRESQPQQHVQHYQRTHYQQQHHTHHRHHRGPTSPQHPPPQPHGPAFDARLEHLERSLNQAMESIRRQTSSSSHQHQQQHHRSHHHQHQQQQQQQQQYFEQHQDGSGALRRFNSEPPFEFRYSQRTMTHEPPQVTEEVETTTLQPIGRGIHDLGGGSRGVAVQQQHSVTEHRVTRSSRLAVRQAAPQEAAAGRSLSANRSATLRASTPVSPKFQQRAAAPGGTLGGTSGSGGTASRGRHLSANAPPPQPHRDFAQVY